MIYPEPRVRIFPESSRSPYHTEDDDFIETRPVTPNDYYRLPWNLADNAITWLGPTTKCNIYCEGCYRANDPDGHKPLGDVIGDLEQIKKMRRTDGISIAGGEPLIYPYIVELVRYVKSQGWKPIIISNGQALTSEFARELMDGGVSRLHPSRRRPPE